MVGQLSSKTNPMSSVNVALYSSICTTPLYENKAVLIQKYVMEKLSARQIGALAGGHIPYGWKIRLGRIAKHTREQKTIGQIMRCKSKGWSNDRVARWLSGRGIKSPSGSSSWLPATVGRICKRANNFGP